MTPLAALQYLTLLWLATEFMVFRRGWHDGAGERRDLGSRLGIIFAITAAVWVSFSSLGLRRTLLPGNHWLWFASGAVVLLGGIALRHQAVSQLGQYFRTQVTVLDDHRLVTSGLYERLRHPSYTGALVSCAGVGLASGTLSGLGAMVLLPVLAFAYRIRVEERTLAHHFGETWQRYAARTRALIPGLW